MDIKHPLDHPGEPDKFEKDWSEGPYGLRHLVMKNDEDVVTRHILFHIQQKVEISCKTLE